MGRAYFITINEAGGGESTMLGRWKGEITETHKGEKNRHSQGGNKARAC